MDWWQVWQVYVCSDCGEEFAVRADEAYQRSPHCPICRKDATLHEPDRTTPVFEAEVGNASSYRCGGCDCTFGVVYASELHCPNCGDAVDGDRAEVA